ncbi:MAG: hypothetical protein A2X36_13730 [Elusimicrobia bacterium GWA2_69_24]|nr:MAG: hypothetical protein A2X36_13730 [Elusimicrobia bacterium GWA2_69_24]HBL18157.1 hypothetical protein [Elusimicrobiota bacterium]
MGRILALLLALSVPAFPAGAVPLRGEEGEVERLLQSGGWNERVWAVNQMGEQGQASLPSLRRALEDLDWQVRLAAVHWLGRVGEPSVPALEGVLSKEECPLVRLAAMHWLGSLEEHAPAGRKKIPAESLSKCGAWIWPMTRDFTKARTKRTKPLEYTERDRAGCQYVRFKRAGAKVCPEGTVVKGVGASPNEVKILKGLPPESGVALCCPVGAADPAEPAAIPRPQEVECRLLADECPPPWMEMDPPDLGFLKPRKERQFRRTERHKEGEINWVHCCRPHNLNGPEAEEPERRAPSGTLVRRPPADPDPYFGEGDGAAPGEGSGEGPGEGGVPEPAPDAEEAAAEEAPPVGKDERMAELDHLLFGTPEVLPRPEGAAPREEPRVAAEPELKLGEKTAAELELERKQRLKGPREDLPAPAGPAWRPGRSAEGEARRAASPREGGGPALEPGRRGLGTPEERLAAPEGAGVRGETRAWAVPQILADHGAPPPPTEVLPDLLKMLSHQDPRQRARAAEAIGSLGAGGRPAVDFLDRALRDREARVRSSAALALANVTQGTDRAVRGLKRALKDKDADVRYSAAAGLGRIGTEAGRQAFLNHMRREAVHLMLTPTSLKGEGDSGSR